MPWSIADVAKHNKQATTPRMKRAWVAAANNALAACERDGGSDCDGRAIRIANAAVKRMQESYIAPSIIESLLPQNSPLRAIGINADNLTEAISLLAQDDSYDARYMAVSSAVRTWARAHALTIAADIYGYAGWAHVVDMYNDVVIFKWNNMLWRAAYTISDENVATLDDPERVRLYYAPANANTAPTADSDSDSEMEGWREVEEPARLFQNYTESDDEPVTEADDVDETDATEATTAHEEMLVESDCIPLAESAVKSDGSSEICVITAGWGSTGYYSADMLKRDCAEAFPKGTHMHWDHPTIDEMNIRPEGSLDSLAGVLTEDAHWDDNGWNGPGVYAKVKVFEKRKEVLDEIYPYIGTSIKAPGVVRQGEAEGRKGRIVESLVPRKTNAVDFVTIAGRGGCVRELVESARSHVTGPATYKSNKNDSGDVEMDREQIEALVNEAIEKATGDYKQQIVQLEATVARQNDALRTRDAREIATAEVAKFTSLGERARERVVKVAIAGEPPLTEANTLDVEAIKTRVAEAAKDEIEYLKAETGHTGRVRDMGSSSTQQESLTDEQVAESLKSAAMALGLSENEAKLFAMSER